MATWGQEARVKYRAWNTSTNAGVAGDSANHTLTLRRAGADSAFVGTVNDLGGGVYEAVVSGTLAETFELAMRGTSSTADVVLFFESPVRTVKAAPTLTEISDLEINALTPTQAAWLEAIYGKTALIGSGMATVSAPVTSEGGIDYLIVGDSYTGGRALEWQAPVGTFGDLTGWTAKFVASRVACGDETILGPIDGTVNNAGLDGQSVTVQVSSVDTSVPAGTYRWAVYVEKDGSKLTLAHGQFAFRKSP